MIAGRYRLLEPLGQRRDELRLARRRTPSSAAASRSRCSRTSADRDRFEREARAAAALSHPAHLPLYDYGEDGRRPYMVLEYLAGGSLEERLGREPARPTTRRCASQARSRPGSRTPTRAGSFTAT